VILPTPPPILKNQQQEIRELFQRFVVPSYGRFNLALSHGAGSHVWDVSGKRYLDLGGGIAVCSLGHAHPEITEALVEQSRRLVHVSNLYYQEPQGRLAQRLVGHLAPGKVFFCNSGAEANEGLFKTARKFGHDEGRFEILTAVNSFHGRTLGGISATGQEKVKKGFEPMVEGFRHIPFNDLEAARAAISPATAAILIEGIQGEGGITPASAEYLLGLRKLCDEKRLLLLLDAVQCGHFRSGRFQSYQRVLEGVAGAEGFSVDGISMAKSLGGGFPIGAFWLRDQAHGVELGQILGPGTHGTTFGGTPLGCAVALRILDVIEREKLADNVRTTGFPACRNFPIGRAVSGRGAGSPRTGLHAGHRIAALRPNPGLQTGRNGVEPPNGQPAARSWRADHPQWHPDCAIVAGAQLVASPGRGRNPNHRESRTECGLRKVGLQLGHAVRLRQSP